MAEPGTLTDQQIRHLEMIQGVITRLGTDSFVIKGWAITLSGAFFGFALSNSDWRLAVVSTIPTLIFWILDTYFLHAERAFRALFDTVRRSPNSVEPFFMSATSATYLATTPAKDTASWRRTFSRPTLKVLYGGLIVAALLVAIAAAHIADPSDSNDDSEGSSRSPATIVA